MPGDDLPGGGATSLATTDATTDAATDAATDTATDAATAVADVRQRSMRGVTAVLLRGIGIRVIGLVGNILLARLLLPSDFGVLALGFTFVVVGMALTDSGLSAGLIRSKTAPTREQLSALLGLQLSVTLLILAVAAVPLWTSGTAGQVGLLMLLSLVPGAFRVPGMIQLERELRFDPVAIAEVLETVVYTALSIALVLAGFGVWGVAAATIVRPFIGVVVLQRAAPLTVLRPSRHWKIVLPLIAFGLTLQASKVVLLVRDQGVNVITVALSSTATLGLWTLAQRVMMVPFLLFDSLVRVSYPAMSRLIDAGHDVRDDMVRALRLGGLLTGLVVVPLAATAPVIVPVVFGPAWLPMVPIVPLSSMGLLISGPLTAVASGYFNATGRPRLVVLAQFASMLAWLVGIPLMLPRIGILAHGWSWAAACLCEALVMGAALARHAGVPVLRAVVPNALCASAAGGAAYLLVEQREATLLVGAVGVVASLGAYLALVAVVTPAAVQEFVRIGRHLASRR